MEKSNISRFTTHLMIAAAAYYNNYYYYIILLLRTYSCKGKFYQRVRNLLSTPSALKTLLLESAGNDAKPRGRYITRIFDQTFER